MSLFNLLLNRMSLADAQSLAIRKALSKSAYDSNVAPGPPLPKSHPSPAFIANLHLECAALYSSAKSLAKTRSASKTSSSDNNGEVSTDLRRYLSDEGAFHSALGRKWLGITAAEQGGEDKGGEAVGFLAWAKKGLEELKDGPKGIGIGKGDKEKRGLRKERVVDELESVNVFYKNYKKINDSVSLHSFDDGDVALLTKVDLGLSAPLPTSANTDRVAVSHSHWAARRCGKTL